ncbi:MAG: S-layer homology domain-containing protein [Candidatus Peribacteraceae bacterium]|nr:S-layer homology domain-containing protein [Candidatus Peribacteraceae bacterium]|tara:strand:+ start:3308 stop:5920 length:2613 start_codon:yes stop_codon:yes gene_type:complete
MRLAPNMQSFISDSDAPSPNPCLSGRQALPLMRWRGKIGRRLLIARFLPLIFLVPLIAHASAEPFSDARNHEFETSIEMLHTRGIVEGYGGSKFQPDILINRAEFLKILMLAVFGEESYSSGGSACFSDFGGVSQWYWAHACTAKERGIIEGYPGGSFKGEKTVNLAEALKMSTEAWKMRRPAYPDGPPNWYDPYFDVAASRRIFLHLPYDPSHLMRRGEMAQLLMGLGQPVQSIAQPAEDNEIAEAPEAPSGGAQCANYMRFGEQLEVCATCGNGVCESFEQCSPSSCSAGGACTSDCGPLYCKGDCSLSGPVICGNGVLEGEEQCDDGNTVNGDGCSKICVIVPETVRHAALRIDQRPVASLSQSVGKTNVVLFAFDAIAGRQDAILNGIKFKSISGSLGSAQNYRLLVDMNGDGLMETTAATASAQGEKITFSNIDASVRDGRTRQFQLRADLSPNASASLLIVGLDTSDLAYVLAVGAIDGKELSGITTDTVECTDSMCWISVFTLDSTGTIDVVERGNLYVTSDTTPIRSRQIRAGEISPVVLRLKFRTEGEDIEIKDFAIAGGSEYLDRLELYENNNSSPFAVARGLSCSIPTTGVFCSNSDWTISADTEKVVLVKAYVRADSPDDVSGNTIALYLTTGTSPQPAVQARGIYSNDTLSQNDGDGNKEGEVFIGTTSASANVTVAGPTHDLVASSITSIQNAHSDSDNASVPVGNAAIGAFRFRASEKASTKSFPVNINNIVFSVLADNVQVDTSSFSLYNTNNPDDTQSCSASADTGDITVTCSNLKASTVATTIDQGSTTSLTLKANILNPQIGNKASTLQVGLRNLGSRSQTGTVEWDDNETTFDWVDIDENRVESTRYYSN